MHKVSIFEASLPQVRDGMWFPKDEVPKNMTLQPIALASKFAE